MIEKMKKILLCFSVVFIIAGVSFITAYNWDKMGNIEKILRPLSLITLGVIGWCVFEKKTLYRQLSIFCASFFVGTLFATYGQIYQTGADSYTLFLSWGLMILIFSCVEEFYPLWFLNIVVLTLAGMLYIKLFYRGEIVIISASIMMSVFTFLYILGIKKIQLKYSGWFFYSLITLSVGLSTVVAIEAIYNEMNRYSHNNSMINIPIILVYLTLLAITYIVGKKIMKKDGVIIICIASATLFTIFSLVAEDFFNVKGLFFSIVILVSSIIFIIKKFSSSKGIQLITNLMKLFLLILIFSLIYALSYTMKFREEQVILTGGILLLILSCLTPKVMKFKEAKSEILTFIGGILIILVYLDEVWNFSPFLIVAIGYTIYGIFWYFRHSPQLDYFLVPSLVLGAYIIMSEYVDKSFYRWNQNLITIPMIFILLVLFYKKKSILIDRATTGSVILLIYLNYEIIVLRDNQSVIQSYVLNKILLLIILKIIYEILNHKNKIIYIVIGLIIIFIPFVNIGMFGIILGIMIILLYLYKKSNFMLGVGVLFLISNISFYYYLLEITLLEKAYMLLKTGGVSLVVFFILKWRFKGEVEPNEKENSII